MRNIVIPASNFKTRLCLPAMLAILGVYAGAPASALTPAELVSNAVNQVRQQLGATLGKTVPSLSLLLETSNANYFASSAATPAQALTPDTYYRFASNTKNFTATAVLHLYQQGFLDIHDRITNSIPGSDTPYVPANTNWNIPYKGEITIEQLLRHSAGVYDVDNDPVPGYGGESFTSWQLNLDPAHQFTVEEMVAQAAIHNLSYFQPNQGYHYSNTGYAMLSEIVARVYSAVCGTSKTCSDYLYEQVVGATAPVPLPAIHFPNSAADTELPAPFAAGVDYLPGGITIVTSNANASGQVGEGNVYGTMTALNRFVRTLMKGENVLNAQMVSLMQTNTAPYNADYGPGCLFVQDVGYGHNGARWGYLSLMVYNPDLDISAVACLPMRDFSGGLDTFMPCFYAIYSAVTGSVSALGYQLTPRLAPGATNNIVLTAGTDYNCVFTAATGVYYSVTAADAAAAVTLGLAPAANPGAQQRSVNRLDWVCPVAGTYRISAASASATAGKLSLNALTHTGPLVTANGLAGDGVCLGAADPLTLAVRVMNADAYIGVPVDWWLAAYAYDTGVWYYLNDNLNWVLFDGNPANCRPVFQGALNNIAPVTVARDLHLPVGTYGIWFAVDYPMDGSLHLDGPVWMSRTTVAVGH